MGQGKAIAKPVGPIKATDTLPLSKTISGNTIVLTWAPIACLGYVLYVNGVRKSNSWDQTKSSWKATYVQGAEYRVVAVGQVAAGSVVG